MEVTVTIDPLNIKSKDLLDRLHPDHIPYWYDEMVHREVVTLVLEDKMLNACKYLGDLSIQKGTRKQFDLKWSKMQIVDQITFLIQREKNRLGASARKEVIVRTIDVSENYMKMKNILSDIVRYSKVKDGKMTFTSSDDYYNDLKELFEKL